MSSPVAGRRDDSEVEAEQQQAAKAGETAATESPAAAQLSRLRGVGPTTANGLADEVFFRDFTAANSPAISGSYRVLGAAAP